MSCTFSCGFVSSRAAKRPIMARTLERLDKARTYVKVGSCTFATEGCLRASRGGAAPALRGCGDDDGVTAKLFAGPLAAAGSARTSDIRRDSSASRTASKLPAPAAPSFGDASTPLTAMHLARALSSLRRQAAQQQIFRQEGHTQLAVDRPSAPAGSSL